MNLETWMKKRQEEYEGDSNWKETIIRSMHAFQCEGEQFTSMTIFPETCVNQALSLSPSLTILDALYTVNEYPQNNFEELTFRLQLEGANFRVSVRKFLQKEFHYHEGSFIYSIHEADQKENSTILSFMASFSRVCFDFLIEEGYTRMTSLYRTPEWMIPVEFEPFIDEVRPLETFKVLNPL